MWGCDVGVQFSVWRNKFEAAKEDFYSEITPQIKWNERIKFWPQYISPSQVSSLEALIIKAAKFDTEENMTSEGSRFEVRYDQGLVLRHGYIFEGEPSVSHPQEFFGETPNPTFQLIEELRKILPLGTSHKGMLLIRVTNIIGLKHSHVHPFSVSITPPHKDHSAYGPHVFSLNIASDSVLVFTKEKSSSAPPICAFPDKAGCLSHFGGPLRTQYYHWVPNGGGKRISITWRPCTLGDPLEEPFIYKNHSWSNNTVTKLNLGF